MPREIFNKDWEFIPREEMLTYEEIVSVVDSCKKLGLEKIRITGGEPLLRKDLYKLIELIKNSNPKLEIALTTNGSLLNSNSKQLKLAGLDRITISLDALDSKLFEDMNDTKIPVKNVLEGIESAINVGFDNLKINCVVKKDINENQIIPLIEYFRNKNIILRFIEFMDVGNSNNWDFNQVITKKQIITKINSKYNFKLRGRRNKSDVGEQWIDSDSGQIIEIISSISEPFCSDCTRARLSSEGKMYTCLFGFQGFDLKEKLRNGGNLVEEIEEIWERRDDRFSELRTEYTTLQPKIEMSYIGG